MHRDVAFDVATHAVGAKFSDLPDCTVGTTKRFVLDTLGVAIAGSSAPGCREVAAYLNEVGGTQESTVIQFGYKVPNSQAAFVNGMMCHALDFDDFHEVAMVHANCSALPTALAMAQSVGGVSGEAFILAYALGVDLTARIGLATFLRQQGWHYTSLCGIFGNALTSAKMLGLAEKETVNALGIALSQASGTLQPVLDCALVKRMHPGFAARGGIFSAMLAKHGLTGSKEVFEGKFGFFNQYEKGSADVIRNDLGKVYEIDNLSTKPHPAGHGTHGALTGVLELVHEHDIRTEDVADVQIVSSRYVHTLCGKPFEIRDNPQVDALFSIPYTVAAAIVRRRFGIEEDQEDAIRNPQILELAARVRCTVDESLNTYLTPVTTHINLKNGRTYSRRVDHIKGNPANPMTEAEHVQKFIDCVKFGVKPIGDARRDQLIRSILALETVSDVREIFGDV